MGRRGKIQLGEERKQSKNMPPRNDSSASVSPDGRFPLRASSTAMAARVCSSFALFASLFAPLGAERARAQSAFQPYNAQGDNLVHVATADFDAVGAKDYVVAMTVNGKVIAFERPAAIADPAADNRLWEYRLPCFAIMIATADIDTSQSTTPDEVLIPCTDGRLRILSSTGTLRHDWEVATGALYCVDVGVDSAGETRVVTGGVDFDVRFFDNAGTLVGRATPPSKGCVRRVVVGNFDGAGGDECVAFYDRKSYQDHNYYHPIDLDTFDEPPYWERPWASEDDVATAFGWTDNQLPCAYDMDGDGDEEVVAHWGVLHPEDGAGTRLLSTRLARGERLYKVQQYENFAEFTDTNRYIMPKGVAGNFKSGDGWTDTEMVTVYGDDLFLVRYDTSKSTDVDRFRPADYGYAHTLYHFCDAARLEDREGGLDKLVLSGPNNGDDHFYVVDFSGDQWKDDAKTIDGGGTLGAVRDTLDELGASLDAFDGTIAASSAPICLTQYLDSWLGWEMTTDSIRTHANEVLEEVRTWRNELGGAPTRVRFFADFKATIYGNDPQQCTDPDITAEGMVAYCAALAERGVDICLDIGHDEHIWVSPSQLADCYEASLVDGECHLMARTRELHEPSRIDLYKPHMDAVLARAAELGAEPPKVMLCVKGPYFSAMTPENGDALFPAYRETLVPGTENSNSTANGWSFAERAGLWLNGDVEDWGCNMTGDKFAANREAEWSDTRNGHVILRIMLAQYAMGARIFRVTSVGAVENPLYERHDTNDPALRRSNPYRQGVVNFLKIVESGAYPCAPAPDQLEGVSPVALAIYQPSERLADQSIDRRWDWYEPQPADYVFNNLPCWAAYTNVPDFDATAFLLNSKRRWLCDLVNSPAGFVPFVPHASRWAVQSNEWCDRAYATDGDTWSEFDSLTEARDTISADLLARRTDLRFYVENECFWQVTRQKNDPDTCFVLLMDSDVMTPTRRSVRLKRGSAAGVWDVFDQFGSRTVPLGTLADAADEVPLVIPAGSVRILTIRKHVPGGDDAPSPAAGWVLR